MPRKTVCRLAGLMRPHNSPELEPPRPLNPAKEKDFDLEAKRKKKEASITLATCSIVCREQKEDDIPTPGI